MHDGFAGKFAGALGEDDHRIGRAFGVFRNSRAQFFFHMRLQGLANVDLLSTDLIPHLISFD